MTAILQTRQLTKVVDGKILVRNANLEVQRGEIYGLLGPNGAGKTTIMKMITGIIRPTQGEIRLFGEAFSPNSYEVLKRMGSIIEYPIFYDRLTARKNLEIHCAYMGYEEKHAIDEALELVNLHGTDRKPVKDFSLGMKQRLGIARAIVTKPEFLLLDEPINGLDPSGIREMRSLFYMLSRDYGMSLIVSSHILNEIEQIADTIGIIKSGTLVEQVTMQDIRHQQAEYLELVTNNNKIAALMLEQQMGITTYTEQDGVIRIEQPGVAQSEVVKTLSLNGIEIESVTRKKRSLEDYFLQIIDGDEKSA